MSKSTAEIRQIFLDFFHNKGHQKIASSSLLPNNDPTLLFTNAGMNQFKNVFLGLDKYPYPRVMTSQRCVRAGGKHNDLKNVGYTAHHHTFFEMLGNFSFSDYFKHEAISFAWELLTSKKWFNLPKDKLWVTVYSADDEAYDIWANNIGISTTRIIRIGDNKGGAYNSDNFWQMGDTGPCGPCSEIFYDYGDHIYGNPPGTSKNTGERYLEIWNLVFMQFNYQSDGTMQPLPNLAIDTGMGLERISAVLQNVHSTYEIDLFQKLITAVAEVTSTHDLKNKFLRVIADHIRSCAFLLSDGVLPSNDGRGYVLRRIIRRAIRHGKLLGTQDTFFYKLVKPLIEVMSSTADQLKLQQNIIEQLLRHEEEQFAMTLERGIALLDRELVKLKGNTLAGEIAFRLYDTYGIPLDLTTDICQEQQLKVDHIGFKYAMEKQQNRARESSKFYNTYNFIPPINHSTHFCGYDYIEHQGYITALFYNGKSVNTIYQGNDAVIVLDITPFYGESGGQIGDQGEIQANDNLFKVQDTQKYGQILSHIGNLSSGYLTLGMQVTAKVDHVRRKRISLNHSAIHLLHAALRQVLGNHVVQRGSLVNDQYLRLDFSQNSIITCEQVFLVEDIINQQIRRNLSIQTNIMELEEAQKNGAIALFGKKYGTKVRVITIGNFSTELCGGIHASRTGDIGLFSIISESGIAAGVRRIEAMTGEGALANVHQQHNLVHKITQLVKGNNQNLIKKIRALQDHSCYLEKEIQKLKSQQAVKDSASLTHNVKTVNGVKVLIDQLHNVEPKQLRIMVDILKNQLGSAIIVLAAINNNKISLIVGVTKDVTNRIQAEVIINNLAHKIGGKGGGRPELAQAGGTNVAALPTALTSIDRILTALL